jgi:addiction module HigA family antidote
MAIYLHDSFAIHPGPWLRAEILQPHGLTVAAAARHLGVSRPPFNKMLNGKAALSPEMAIRFEKAFGISARTLLNMQAMHSLATADADKIKVAPISEPA